MTGRGVGIAGLLRLGEQADWNGALTFTLPLSVVFSFDVLSAYYVCRSQPYSQRRWPVTLSFVRRRRRCCRGWCGWACGEVWNCDGHARW